MSGISVKDRTETLKVPCRRIACYVADGLESLDVAVTTDGMLFVHATSPGRGPHGIEIPIGRVTAVLHDLIDAEFKRSRGET